MPAGAEIIADQTTFTTIVAWLGAPLSGSAQHSLAPWVYWHARLMVLAWNIVIPVGMLAARFLKVPRRTQWPDRLDHKLWWRSHVALQCVGVSLMTVGVLLAFGRGILGTQAAAVHHWIGWSLLGVGWLQTFGGLLRGTKGGPTATALRGDHYDMTVRRVVFEHLHKLAGWLAVPLIVITTGIGLVIADAPRWMAAVLILWWFILGAGFAWLQTSGYCIDTYQAIWGRDPAHPGNARSPIGWGVRRIGAATGEDSANRVVPSVPHENHDG